MIKIQIDDKNIEVAKGKKIIEVAEQLGIYIPRFCYYKKLSIASSCRICLVEVVGNAKLLPACSTIVQDGMKILTNSKKVIAARSAMLDLLLANHPLDCPICDKAGACELQDIVFKYGKDNMPYHEEKRAIYSKDFNYLIKTEMTRCIHCMRCVRFCKEVSGTNDLSVINRGEDTTIIPFADEKIKLGVIGNIIELCPVGAILAKSNINAKNWELKRKSSIGSHDCLGTNIYFDIKDNNIVRVVPRENDNINETWIADRDRFSYDAINHKDRLGMPLYKDNGKWKKISWEEALNLVNNNLKHIITNDGANQIGSLVSSSATVEDQCLLQKYLRAMGSNNIDHRLWQLDFAWQNNAELYPNLSVEINFLELQKLIFIIGADLNKEQPLLELRLRKTVAFGGKICMLNGLGSTASSLNAKEYIVEQGDLAISLLAIIKLLLNQVNIKSNYNELFIEVQENLNTIVPTKQDENIANLLLEIAGKKLILLGNFATSHPQSSFIILLSKIIAELINANHGQLSKGANAAGAWLTGCIPHRKSGGIVVDEPGKNTKEMLSAPLKSYVLMGIEPELDSIFGIKALDTMKQADFNIAFTSFTSKCLLEVSNLLLPITTFAEMNGTFINIAGEWQSFEPAVESFQSSLPAWEILNKLADLASLKTFNYKSREDLIEELLQTIKIAEPIPTLTLRQKLTMLMQYVAGQFNDIKQDVRRKKSVNDLMWVTSVPMYKIDPLVRRSELLQGAFSAKNKVIAKINKVTANKLEIEDNDLIEVKTINNESIILPVEIDNLISIGSIFIEHGTDESLQLGIPYDYLSVKRCKQ